MLYNALIRTHHITSRKKVSLLKRAADAHNCFVLLRSGGVPGIMYVEGQEGNVESWVGVVKGLKYKDFQLVTRPGPLVPEDEDTGNNNNNKNNTSESGNRKGKQQSNEVRSKKSAQRVKSSRSVQEEKAGVEEVESVKDFGSLMSQKGLWRWWRRGMGYENAD